MHKSAVFVIALIVCSHLVFSAEGIRKIKSVNKIDSKQSNQVDNSGAMHKSASGKKQVLPPPLPNSVAGYKDAFRPTTPGNSPGAGHSSFPGSNSSSDDKHSIAGATDDFRRTNPGHSPGVGHVFEGQNSEPNA
ncbi:hypothetical protein PTKIN_Ptkin07bG0277400 [Pterospermum kingtungense]